MNSRWDDRFQRFQTVALVVSGLALLLLVGLPSLTMLFELSGQGTPPQLARFVPLLEPIYAWLLRAFLAVWIVFFGGCIASFLNVVAWRLPRGRSILGRSHCPQCQTQLSLRENLPIYGWLACGGQCRYCQQPIPARYVLVELYFGLILLLVGLLEVGLGGWSLPRPLVHWDNFSSRSLFVIDADLIWIFASHVCLLSGLYACVLVRLESRTIPRAIFWTTHLAGLLMVAASPAVAAVQWLGTGTHPTEMSESIGTPLSWSLLLAVTSSLLGFLFGWFSSQLAVPRSARQLSPPDSTALPVSAPQFPPAPGRAAKILLSWEAALVLGIVGTYLGLWGMLGVGLGAVAVRLFAALAAWGRSLSYSRAAFIATIVYLCCWRLFF